jgi:hypothetical protein
MKSYLDFINESNQYVDLYIDGYGFRTSKYGASNSIKSLNDEIYKYINKVYSPFGFEYGKNDDVKINDTLIINGEYISKMVNNYTIFKKFIKINKIKDESTFYRLILNSFDDIYHYNGDFFMNESLPILINTTRKGRIFEKESLDRFVEYASGKGIDITIINPTVEEDIKGIDAKFISNAAREYTIQVKPFTSVQLKGDFFYAKSSGSLSLGVDYLILYSDDGSEYILLRNSPSNPINISGGFFVYKKENILL